MMDMRALPSAWLAAAATCDRAHTAARQTIKKCSAGRRGTRTPPVRNLNPAGVPGSIGDPTRIAQRYITPPQSVESDICTTRGVYRLARPDSPGVRRCRRLREVVLEPVLGTGGSFPGRRA